MPTNGFTYRFTGHQPLKDERPRQISEGTIEERETQSKGVETRKGKEVAREKHCRS